MTRMSDLFIRKDKARSGGGVTVYRYSDLRPKASQDLLKVYQGLFEQSKNLDLDVLDKHLG